MFEFSAAFINKAKCKALLKYYNAIIYEQMASNDSDTNFLKMQDLDVKCAIFFVLFTHNFHSHSSTVRFIHSYSWQKFSYSI